MTGGSTAPPMPVDIEMPPPYGNDQVAMPPPPVNAQSIPPGMCLSSAEYIVEQSAMGFPKYPLDVPLRLRDVIRAEDYTYLTSEMRALEQKYLQPPWYYFVLFMCFIICKCE